MVKLIDHSEITVWTLLLSLGSNIYGRLLLAALGGEVPVNFSFGLRALSMWSSPEEQAISNSHQKARRA
jgi:hypothetical protein